MDSRTEQPGFDSGPGVLSLLSLSTPWPTFFDLVENTLRHVVITGF